MTRARTAIEALEKTLRREIAALEAGDFAKLVETQTRKEVEGAELERCLIDEPGAIERDRLYELKALIARNQAGLQGAIDTTRAIVRQVEEVRAQHSVASNYGPRGLKSDDATKRPGKLNQSF